MQALEELRALIGEIAERGAVGVVGVGRGWGWGAGVVLGEGRVLTNAHNLHGEEVAVAFPDGRTETARVAGHDVDGDLAVLEVDTAGLSPLPWGDGSQLTVGTPVLALTPTRANRPRVTVGLVSATGQAFRGPRGRRIVDAVEHTAPLARGSSGSPLLDTAGRLVGLNTHRRGEGFYLAIPAAAALRERIEALGRGQSVRRARLGIAVAPAGVARRMREAVGLPAQDGLLVRGVDEQGPAGQAGVRHGDLIVAAGDAAVQSSDQLFAILDQLSGDSLTLRLLRGSEERTVTVNLARPATEG